MTESAREPLDELWVHPREYELGAARWQDRVIDELSRAIHPVLAQMTRETVQDLPQEQDESSPEAGSSLYRGIRVRHEWVWNANEILDFDVESYLAQLYETADSIGGQLVRGMFDHISSVADEHGQVMDASGRNFYEVLIEMTDKMDIDFDEDGSPKTMLVVHPETFEKLSQEAPTPEQEQRLKAVLDRKREEWRASRSRRDLP